MKPELEKLLIDWKLAGRVDCRKSLEAVEKYINNLDENQTSASLHKPYSRDKNNRHPDQSHNFLFKIIVVTMIVFGILVFALLVNSIK